MRTVPAVALVGWLGLIAAMAADASRQTASPAAAAPAGAATTRIVTAAEAFVATLDDAGRAKVQFPAGSPQKSKWSNFPTGIFPRAGIRLGDLTTPQRTAAMAVLSVALSQDGYRKVLDIMGGDEALRRAASSRPAGGGAGGGPGGGPGGGRGPTFGEDEYYIAFIGTPSVTTPWMLQFGGHHLAINLTLTGAQATLAPSHTAAQPARYTFEGRTIRPLGNENDRAFALMATLDATQKAQAILGYAVADLVLGPGQDGRTIQPEGLPASALSASQQTLLMQIVGEWAGIANDALAAPRLAEIRANLPRTWFAWSGPTTDGSAAYFRIQGPTVVIEYAPQRGIDHVHTIYRDPTNDYGRAHGAP